MIIIPLSRNVFVHLYHCSTGNTINFELFIPTLVSPFQIPINFNAPWKPKEILEKQFLNGAKCIATRMFQSLSFDGLWNTSCCIPWTNKTFCFTFASSKHTRWKLFFSCSEDESANDISCSLKGLILYK